MNDKNFVHTPTEELVRILSKIIRTEIQGLRSILDNRRLNEYMTRKEVADHLRINVSSVHNLTVKGIISKYQIAGKVLYKRQEIEAALIKLR